MEVALESKAEQKAQEAEALPIFGGLNLLHIKRQVAFIVSLIGRGGIFDEYTRHDISHINSMLQLLEWIIPKPTQEIMSTADWLLVVLSVYFHDVGMLVTREEFELRDESSFPSYCEELFSGQFGVDYREKVYRLGPDDTERFLYQEFVRFHHPERVKAWVSGKPTNFLGVADKAFDAIDNVLSSLDRQFRRNLGMICASHHLDDLVNLDKYKVNRAYGQDSGEVCNLQYCAILLRSADLLHITCDRTPSIIFKLINPTDPISQQEWAKQQGVRRVCPAHEVTHDSQENDFSNGMTIDVHAYFEDPKSFFGLTSYLLYAEKELEKCFHWAKLAQNKAGVLHCFPWRYIDDSNIETKDFLPQTFSFKLNQTNILDLLVGHTLYNNAEVVIRELLQNSLDAVRLQQLIDRQNGMPITEGVINIIWDSVTKALIVEDNGTGMTQDIIGQHLLNVGASRYQDTEFKKDFPTFSPISRFGIGILSTFMVSDEVIMLTSHPDDEEAREISIRSVHGKYLIRLIDKKSNDNQVGTHGTRVVVKLRHSAKIENILDSVKQWLILPGEGISVFVTIDTKEPVKIGYSTLKESVQDLFEKIVKVDERKKESQRNIEFHEKTVGPVTIVYALRWDEKTLDWRFVNTLRTIYDPLAHSPVVGTCFEGIKIDGLTPGFDDACIVAMANFHGKDAPKTNISRNGFEVTTEYEKALKLICDIYAQHIMSQFNELKKRKANSLSRSINALNTIITSLLGRSHYKSDSLQNKIFWDVFDRLPIVLVEKVGERKCLSICDLRDKSHIWTIDSPFYRWAEGLLCEVPRSLSLSTVANSLTEGAFVLNKETILCIYEIHELIKRRILSQRSIDLVSVEDACRRVDLRWTLNKDSLIWLMWDADKLSFNWNQLFSKRSSAYSLVNMIPIRGVQFSGCGSEVAVKALGILLLNPASPVVSYIIDLANKYHETMSNDTLRDQLDRALQMFNICLRMKGNFIEKVIKGKMQVWDQHLSDVPKWPYEEIKAFSSFAEITNWVFFDPNEFNSEGSIPFGDN